ncbi:hypothetical protein BT96DRAFT_930049 [Gymnopus androsaceus JB14]|uniref:Uncharacterized protein n=1 Tax=Gymnopus androsaceus JB14 TaxID=1447944 RepID=A0A6A4GC60_9AGAR|nr:hypothetical protein BT96DRAFT_930049 [Gymnopus androsaceus JB14]
MVMIVLRTLTKLPNLRAKRYFPLSMFKLITTINGLSFHRQLQSIRGLSIDLATEEIYPPPLCHHAANRDRPLEWCTMSVVLRHRDDLNPNTAVVGYLTPLTHQCIFHPIYCLAQRRQRAAQDERELRDSRERDDF